MTKEPHLPVLWRYVLYQVPGWIACGIGCGLLWSWGLPDWAVVGIFALWLAKDAALYPLLRSAYERGVPTGAGSLVGEEGTARAPIAPRGWIRIRGERWRAELAPGEMPILAGDAIRVVDARGLTLVVARRV